MARDVGCRGRIAFLPTSVLEGNGIDDRGFASRGETSPPATGLCPGTGQGGGFFLGGLSGGVGGIGRMGRMGPMRNLTGLQDWQDEETGIGERGNHIRGRMGHILAEGRLELEIF